MLSVTWLARVVRLHLSVRRTDAYGLFLAHHATPRSNEDARVTLSWIRAVTSAPAVTGSDRAIDHHFRRADRRLTAVDDSSEHERLSVGRDIARRTGPRTGPRTRGGGGLCVCVGGGGAGGGGPPKHARSPGCHAAFFLIIIIIIVVVVGANTTESVA